jgi:signal transduction histidine kinase
MRGIGSIVRRHPLSVAFAAALVPLAVLFALQVRWLARLERASAIAQETVLRNYVEAVGTKVRYHYESAAERALNVPAAYIAERPVAIQERATGAADVVIEYPEVAQYWEKRVVRGARRLFLVDYVHEQFGHFVAYEPETRRMVQLPASPEAMAIILACAPFHMQQFRERNAVPPEVLVDERDPENRVILNPILDDDSNLIGVAGMVLDDAYFERELLPGAIAKALPEFLPDVPRDQLVMTVSDGTGRQVLTVGRGAEGGDLVVQRFPFVYTDWSLGIRSGAATPAQWARRNRAYNLGFTALLSIVLLGGIAMALRTAGRAMHLSQMKADFVSNVSHELRTPLASIRVFAEFLKLGRASTPDKVREYGDRIDLEGRRLSHLIDNILDFSRIESGRKTYQFVPADLHGIVEAVVRGFTTRLEQSSFAVEMQTNRWKPTSLALDPDAIAQAVGNLLDNAIKYSGDARRIRVELRREDDTAVVAVSDHGIGIPRAEQRKIFERFHRVGTGLVHDVKGAGLGLSIVHHVVQAHHGRVVVDSEPGRGSTFAIHLPVPPAAAAPSGVTVVRPAGDQV